MTSSDEKNASVIEALRDAFAPALERLTPEIEPAIVFLFSREDCENGE